MIFLRKPVTKITEDTDNIDKDTQDIVDADLQQKKAQLLQQKTNAKMQYDRTVQRIDAQILQLYNQQANKNKKNQQTTNQQEDKNQTQQNESLFEGKNSKRDLLGNAIKTVIQNLDTSYLLSDAEIHRLSRKINDILNSNKNSNNLLNIVKYEIKKYLLNHNRISLSQTEINNFINLLEKELQKQKYKVFSYLFNSNIDSIKININDNTNIDELEAELTDLDFNIDEDLDDNTLTLTNINDFNIKNLKKIIKNYDLMKINYNLFY